MHYSCNPGMTKEQSRSFSFSCEVRANPLLQRVFTNLASNAVQYGSAGSLAGISAVRRGGSCLVSAAGRGDGAGFPSAAPGSCAHRRRRRRRGDAAETSSHAVCYNQA